MGLAGAVLTTFGTYVVADTLSNFLQHYPQKMDYGKGINTFLNATGISPREVKAADNHFWGTRTEHILGVAGALAATDHLSQAAWRQVVGSAFSFKTNPAPFMMHTFVFIAGGVALYCAADAYFNPDYANKNRSDGFYQNLHSTLIGSMTAALHEPFWGALAFALMPALAKNPATALVFGGLIPATLAYATVKGVGWNDWGTSGLNEVEKRFNNILV